MWAQVAGCRVEVMSIAHKLLWQVLDSAPAQRGTLEMLVAYQPWRSGPLALRTSIGK